MNGARRPAPFLRFTSLAFLLFGAGAALLIGGLVLRSPAALFLALPWLLAGPAAALGGPRGPVALRVDRTAGGSGMEVLLKGHITPKDSADPRDLELKVDRPSGLETGGPSTTHATRLALDFEYRWRVKEPTVVVVPSPRIVWRDATGLVERTTEFDASDLVVERYPPELVRVGAVRLRRTMMLPGETRSQRVGAVGEFYGLRDAFPSDPFRQINWRASARAGRLLANEYQLDRTGDVLLFLDARGTVLGPRVDERLLAISRAAAAGIAESFLREKSRVGVAVFSEFVDAAPLASGRSQRLRIRSVLLGARLGPEGVPAERGAVSVSRYFPAGVTTVVFSSLADETSRELVLHLRRRGYPVIVLSPSPLPILGEGAPLPAEDELLAARIARLARRIRVTQSWQEAPTVDWDDYWSLARFVELLRRPTTRRLG
jgi:uncharacterized protein (DUF58 family)